MFLPLTSLGTPTKQLWLCIPSKINRGLINGAGFVPLVFAAAAPKTPHGEPVRVISDYPAKLARAFFACAQVTRIAELVPKIFFSRFWTPPLGDVCFDA